MRFLQWFHDLGMRVKLLSIVAAQLVIVGVAFMWMFKSEVDGAARTDTIAQASRVVDMAESVRHGMSEKWRTGVFDQQLVAQWAKSGEVDRVLASVPIVSAWEAVMMKAEAGGYQFKTPRFNARNPQNEPDEVEGRALQLFANSPSEEEYSEYDADRNVIRYFRPIRLTQQCLTCHGNPSSSQEYWGNSDGIDGTGHEMENLAVGDLHGAYEVIQSLDSSDARAEAATLKGLGIVTACILLSCTTLVWVLNRSLVAPLHAASEAFKRLVRGDLRHEINVKSKDEIGMLQAGINAMVKQLRTMIGSMRSNSDELGEVSTSLDTTAQCVGEASTSTTSRSQIVSAAAEEMSQSLECMRGSLAEVSSTVQSIAAASTQVLGNAKSIASNTEESSTVAQQAQDLATEGGVKVHELEVSAKGIGEIVNVIKDITEQINLLALNATIEASRAGEAGNGFAVVAGEIKLLASDTAKATTQIRQRIESIQGTSNEAVDAMSQIESVIQKLSDGTLVTSEAVEEQCTTIESITRQLEQASALTSNVTHNVEETVAAARDVSRSIHEVHQIAEKTGEEVASTQQAGVNVRKVSQDFREQLEHFAV